jgi:hypothetical protein
VLAPPVLVIAPAVPAPLCVVPGAPALTLDMPPAPALMFAVPPCENGGEPLPLDGLLEHADRTRSPSAPRKLALLFIVSTSTQKHAARVRKDVLFHVRRTSSLFGVCRECAEFARPIARLLIGG